MVTAFPIVYYGLPCFQIYFNIWLWASQCPPILYHVFNIIYYPFTFFFIRAGPVYQQKIKKSVKCVYELIGFYCCQYQAWRLSVAVPQQALFLLLDCFLTYKSMKMQYTASYCCKYITSRGILTRLTHSVKQWFTG